MVTDSGIQPAWRHVLSGDPCVCAVNSDSTVLCCFASSRTCFLVTSSSMLVGNHGSGTSLEGDVCMWFSQHSWLGMHAWVSQICC